MSTPARPLIIDFHTHCIDAEIWRIAEHRTVLSGFGTRTMARGGSAPSRVGYLDPDRHVADMDARGIDMHMISNSSVVAGTSWADAASEPELVRRANDNVAAWIARHPTRFIGSFVLPLQDMDAALRELARAVDELGLRVVNAPACVGALYLGHPYFAPFWQAVAARALLVFIHPEGTPDPWYQDFSLWNSVGQPVEEAKVMSSIIYEGIFDRHPGVKIVMSHGGGFLPHYIGRMDRNIVNMPDSVRNISRKPSDYLASFHYDTCTYDPATLARLISIVGAERIVMGSDYPSGEKDPVDFVARAGNVSAEQLAAIAGGTVAGLLGLGSPER